MIKRGYTLAEVLTTVVILGIIAVIVVPNVVKRFSDRADISRLKLAYSLVSNAIDMAVVENGPIEDWDWPEKAVCNNIENSKFFAQQLEKYFNISEKCLDDKTCNKCFGGYYYHETTKPVPNYTCNATLFKWVNGETKTDYTGGSSLSRFSGYTLKNGISIAFHPGCLSYKGGEHSLIDYTYGPDGKYGGGIVLIDINGTKGPNQYGYDIFKFSIHRSPGRLRFPPENYFNFNSNDCSKKNASARTPGTMCGYWVLKHNNMDYKYKEIADDEF